MRAVALTLSLQGDGVFRAGWTVNQGRFYRRLAAGSGVMRGCPSVNHLGVLMQISHRRCVEPRYSNRPGKSEVLPGREPSAIAPLPHRNIACIRAAQRGLARQMMASVRAQKLGVDLDARC